MVKQPRIEIPVEPKSDEIEFVNQQILKFNSSRVGEGNYKLLVILLRDSDSHIVGGLLGETYWQWLHVDVLWIHESFLQQSINLVLNQRNFLA